MRMLVVALALATTMVAACGGNPTAPSSTSTPGGPVAPMVPPPTMPGPPASFTFFDLANMNMPSSEVPVWGLRGQNTIEIVKQMVFCDATVTAPGNTQNAGLRPMIRPDAPVSLVYDTSIVGAIRVLENGVSTLGNVISFPVSLGTTPVAGVRFDVRLEGAGPVAQSLIRYDSKGGVTGGFITFKTLQDVTDFRWRHELGHVAGFCHSNVPGLMSGSSGNSTNPTDHNFSLAERDNIAVMLKLTPGTAYPGAGASTSLGLGRTSTIVVE